MKLAKMTTITTGTTYLIADSYIAYKTLIGKKPMFKLFLGNRYNGKPRGIFASLTEIREHVAFELVNEPKKEKANHQADLMEQVLKNKTLMQEYDLYKKESKRRIERLQRDIKAAKTKLQKMGIAA